MKNILHRLLSLLCASVLTLAAAVPAFAAGEERYTVRDAYMYFAEEDPEFLLNILESGYEDGVGESMILRFLISVQQSFYFQNRVSPVTEDNFQSVFIDKLKLVSNAAEYSTLQTAIYNAYPEASNAIRNNRIHSSIAPLYNAVKDMVLNRNMLDRQEAMENYTFRMEAVEEPAPLSAVQLGELPALPDSVRVLSESGLYVKMPVSWNEAPDTAYPGSAKVLGRVLPQTGAIPGGFDGRIELDVEISPLSMSGTCGSNLTWALENGVLTVSGSGRMTSYSNADRVPWASVRDAINKIVIGEGVSSVGSFAFSGIKNLASPSVNIPSTVTSLGRNAFAGTALDTVRLSSRVSTVSSGAFDAGVTLYGGKTGGAAYRYAAANDLTFVPDDWTEPEIISVDARRSGGVLTVEIDSMNTDGLELVAAAYGSGMELLDAAPVSGGSARLADKGAKYVKVFCWDGLTPLCAARSLRLTA